MMSLWTKIKGLFGTNKSTQKTDQGSKKKSKHEGEDENVDNNQWKVERKHEYEEVNLPENGEESQDPDPQQQYKVVKQPRPYEEVTLPNEEDDTRLSKKETGGELNYVDLEFSTKSSNSDSQQKTDINKTNSVSASVEYSEVTVQNSQVSVSDK